MPPITNQPSTIYRYEVEPKAGMADLAIRMPEGCLLLKVDHSAREGVAAMWFLVPITKIRMDETHVIRRFRIFGTGHEIPPSYRYLGSTPEGAFVWHVFEWERSAVKPAQSRPGKI